MRWRVRCRWRCGRSSARGWRKFWQRLLSRLAISTLRTGAEAQESGRDVARMLIEARRERESLRQFRSRRASSGILERRILNLIVEVTPPIVADQVRPDLFVAGPFGCL